MEVQMMEAYALRQRAVPVTSAVTTTSLGAGMTPSLSTNEHIDLSTTYTTSYSTCYVEDSDQVSASPGCEGTCCTNHGYFEQKVMQYFDDPTEPLPDFSFQAPEFSFLNSLDSTQTSLPTTGWLEHTFVAEPEDMTTTCERMCGATGLGHADTTITGESTYLGAADTTSTLTDGRTEWGYEYMDSTIIQDGSTTDSEAYAVHTSTEEGKRARTSSRKGAKNEDEDSAVIGVPGVNSLAAIWVGLFVWMGMM